MHALEPGLLSGAHIERDGLDGAGSCTIRGACYRRRSKRKKKELRGYLMEFRIRSAQYTITPEIVRDVTRGVEPNAADGRHKYFIDLHGRRFPIRQVLQLVTGLTSPGFTSQDAFRILSRLGFQISERPDTRVYRASASMRNAAVHASEPTPGATVALDAPGAGQDLLNLLVVFERDEDGWEAVSCPTLPGCHSQGRTRDEALANIREAIRGYLASMREHGEPLPASSEFQVLEVSVA